MLLYYVRHGHPDYKTDSLTTQGKIQAEEVGKRLSTENISAIYASPLGRAQQTAKPLADRLGLSIQILNFMEEIHTGAPKGTKEEEKEHYFPWTLYQELVDRKENLIHFDYESYPYWNHSPAQVDSEKVAKEFDAWLETLGYRAEGDYYRCMRENHDSVALFAHGAVGTALAAHLLRLPMIYCCAHFQFGFCGVSIYRFEGKEKHLICPSVLQLNGSQLE